MSGRFQTFVDRFRNLLSGQSRLMDGLPKQLPRRSLFMHSTRKLIVEAIPVSGQSRRSFVWTISIVRKHKAPLFQTILSIGRFSFCPDIIQLIKAPDIICSHRSNWWTLSQVNCPNASNLFQQTMSKGKMFKYLQLLDSLERRLPGQF